MCGQDFILLPEAPSLVRKVVSNGRVVGEGTYARVYAIDSHTVLKLTTCKVTVPLLDSRIHEPVTGMVKVFKAFGPVAKDEDGMVYSAYIVERLYSQEEWQSLPNVVRVKKTRTRTSRFIEKNGKLRRVCMRETVRAPKRRRKRTHETLDAVIQRIRKPIRQVLRTGNRQKGAKLFRTLKRQMGNSVVGALSVLEEFTLKQNAELDLLSPGNVMLSFDGELCLSDPVTEMVDNTLPPVPASPFTGPAGEEANQDDDCFDEFQHLMAELTKATRCCY